MGGNVAKSISSIQQPVANSIAGGKVPASPVPPPNAPGFSNVISSVGNALQNTTSQAQQPMMQPSMMGGKSSGAGQGGYGNAPGFGEQLPPRSDGLTTGGPGIEPSPETLAYHAQNRANQMFNPYQQPMFNPYQQPRFNPYQQPMFNPFQQSRFGQFQQPMQQPQFDQQQYGLMALNNLLGGIFGRRGRRG